MSLRPALFSRYKFILTEPLIVASVDWSTGIDAVQVAIGGDPETSIVERKEKAFTALECIVATLARTFNVPRATILAHLASLPEGPEPASRELYHND